MLGTSNLNEFYESSMPWLAWTLVISYTFFVVIVLLNVLIAIMGSVYQEVSSNMTGESLLEVTACLPAYLPGHSTLMAGWLAGLINVLRERE